MLAQMLADSFPGERTRIRTAYGELLGTWRGRNAAATGENVDVELSTTRPYRWNETHGATERHTEFAVVDEAHTRVAGEVVELDENDVLTLRAGDTFLLIDTEGTAPLGVRGSRVSLTVDDLDIYPSNV